MINYEWISVEDKLPDEEVSVLVIQDGNHVCNYLILQAQIFEGFWYADHENGIIDFHSALNVTHWTPLPPKFENVK